jgi:hypothetical protein
MLLLVSWSIRGQEALYRVYFKDKGEQKALLETPERFLSGKAIWRRVKHNIAIDETDLPVSRLYLSALSAEVTQVKTSSKWLNAAVVQGGNRRVLEGLPFVQKVEAITPLKVHFADAGCAAQSLTYGSALVQTEMVKGNELHDFGFTGQGMTIGVIDGGFTGALSTTTGFDSLYSRGQILGAYDFIQNDTNVFEGGFHGTLVLSTMGGYVEGGFVGAAPDASYWLLKSENESSETTVEMDNWVRAAEFADSVGVDVINSSLGYSTFDGGVGDLSPSDMDGNTAVVTLGADMAAKKGILVVVSAGNSGTSFSWPIINAPGDGDSVLTVGGVSGSKNYVSFSSKGPTADGRIKPDVVAMAQGTAFVRQSGVVGSGNGTSFSSPIIAGFAACLWQSKPSLSNMDIYWAIKNSASHAYMPNNEIGFGIPNFAAASFSINLEEDIRATAELSLYPNPTHGSARVHLSGVQSGQTVQLQWFDLSGKQVLSETISYIKGLDNQVRIPEQKGLYLLKLLAKDAYLTQEVVVD